MYNSNYAEINEFSSDASIVDALRYSSFYIQAKRLGVTPGNIRAAALNGCLLWTDKHLVSTQGGNAFELTHAYPDPWTDDPSDY